MSSRVGHPVREDKNAEIIKSDIICVDAKHNYMNNKPTRNRFRPHPTLPYHNYITILSINLIKKILKTILTI